MYKGGRIIAFAALFCLAVLSPFIVNLANAAPAPETTRLYLQIRGRAA